MHYTEDIRHAPDEEYVCWCSRVSKGDVCNAIREGAESLAAVRAVTGACTQGLCAHKNPRGR